MEMLLNKIIEWIEYFKKSEHVTNKRLTVIEDYLENSSQEKLDDLMKRLEALENESEVIEDEIPIDEFETDEEVDEDVITPV